MTPAPQTNPEQFSAILQAVARGWCAPENAHKVMDPALAQAIAREVSALTAAPREADAEVISYQNGDESGGYATYIKPLRDLPSGTKLYATAPLPREGGEECSICPGDMLHDGPCDYAAPVAAGEWVTVPRVPTAKMLGHAWDECALGGEEDYRDFWRAMLSAAPSPPVAGDMRVAELIAAVTDLSRFCAASEWGDRSTIDTVERLWKRVDAALESLAAPAPVAERSLPTERRVQAVETLLALGYQWGGKAWAAPVAEDKTLPGWCPACHGSGEAVKLVSHEGETGLGACDTCDGTGDGAAHPAAPPAPVNFRGEKWSEARTQLVNVLKAQKSWLTGYAEAYVDEFADMSAAPAARPSGDAEPIGYVAPSTLEKLRTMSDAGELTTIITKAKRGRIAIYAGPYFANKGDSEAQFIADGENLDCQACGGSGHVGDIPGARPSGEVTEETVERFRAKLWSTWGAGRQTTDWPSREELRAALLAALRPEGVE